ncbi:MAG: DUF421 domain-containing protein [Oscillospiraceae bacterium]|nr:DUF421 domain-containing protein [Oscillospiraceae bacterium]
MLTTIIRTVILYLAAVFSVRLMGKRQIGELQPAELVVTILLSEIAAIPIQDNDIPLINSIVPLMLLVGFEILSSVIGIKSVRFRKINDGNPFIIIKDGVIDQKKLKALRLTVDDLLSALRQKDVFDISDVEYAVMETNGSVSLLLKPEKRGVTAQDMNITVKDSGFLCPVIIDGRIIGKHLSNCGFSRKKLDSALKKANLSQNEVLLMTVDKNGKTEIIKKEAGGI